MALKDFIVSLPQSKIESLLSQENVDIRNIEQIYKLISDKPEIPKKLLSSLCSAFIKKKILKEKDTLFRILDGLQLEKKIDSF